MNHIARDGETEYVSIHRNRSGQDAGEIDYGIDTLRVRALSEDGAEKLMKTVDQAAACLKRMLSRDRINHPPHYTQGKIEPIDVIEDWGLGFHLGNALKYLARAAHKGSEVDDLKKCRWYLDRYIEKARDA